MISKRIAVIGGPWADSLPFSGDHVAAGEQRRSYTFYQGSAPRKRAPPEMTTAWIALQAPRFKSRRVAKGIEAAARLPKQDRGSNGQE